MVFRGNRILTLGFHDPYWGSIVYAQRFQVPKSFWGYILQDAEELEYILGKDAFFAMISLWGHSSSLGMLLIIFTTLMASGHPFVLSSLAQG